MMELWTAATPNGWKVNIMVEELIEAGIEMPEMKIRSINLSKGEQFTDEFTEKNPNQKQWGQTQSAIPIISVKILQGLQRVPV